ncbi:hypothetical protein BIY22_04890 [Vibrio panuliri]|uniref:Sel1 repeat family protein n=1 Tax=Vibrio panuliri TaxID=1381081 RepID=A0A1Q9HJ48_9VIBR|nr:hypothetical protein [Vibrio panuliri]OLQ90337.1 hypothetical protein BIY22_04890 [Vibrio panuliri]
MKAIKTLCASTLVTALASFNLHANPTPEMLANYNLAAQGDEALVDTVYEQLHALIEQQGAKPVSLVYLGSTETLRGRDAFLPWNKMKFTEQGLATIAKGVALIETLPQDTNQHQRIQGLPEAHLTQAMAAVTYTSLPDLFNHFERGYDLYLNLLADPSFTQQPFTATAWVYKSGIDAALRADDLEQANQWLVTMQQTDASNPQTQSAQDLLAEQN